ncbi:sensor histidine kinase [Nocardia lasii]|uniref:histidine kinase n=1 Tax=Nocardia lasii TaxID=1616107 RepID=A0ABW1JKW9_9NOCA
MGASAKWERGSVVPDRGLAVVIAGVVGSRWRTYSLVAVAYLVAVAALLLLLGRSVAAWQVVGLLALGGVLVATAAVVRQRRDVVLARERQAQAVQGEEQAQQARVAAEERLEIARELHDVLAHSLSLINTQASVALELFDRKPQQAAAALATIKTTSKESLAEVHSLLQAIRSGTAPEYPEAPVSDAEAAPPRNVASPRAPAPTLDDLDILLEHPRATGLDVDTKIIGMPKKLPGAIDVAAARIVLESLNNVARHAPGARALITLRYTPESIDITVDNSRPTETAVRTGIGGNGIIAMRERAHALGGALTAGPRPSGGFRVAARLPARPAVLSTEARSASSKVESTG